MSFLQGQRYAQDSNKQENCNKILAFQLKKIKAPLYVVDLVATNKPLYKLYSTYLAFKALEKSGQIFNYTAKANDIAALFGISPKTLHTRVTALVKLGLLTRTLKNLTIAPYSKLNSLHPDKPTKYAFVRVKPNISLEYSLRTINIKKSLEKQAHTVISLIKRFDDVDTLTATYKLGEYRSSIIQAFQTNKPVGIFPPCNIDISVSQSKIAAMYNLKSQTSGHYWSYRMAQLGLCTVENRMLTSEARTREKDAPRFGRWNYNQKDNVSFLTLCNYLSFWK